MTKSTLFIKGQGVKYTRVFDSVARGLGSNCGLLLGKIAGFCEMSDNSCLKSQDELSFITGISIKTIKRLLDILVKESLIIDHTKIIGIPHKYSLNEQRIREFDRKYIWARDSFLLLEQKIIEKSDEDTIKKYVSVKGKTPKILRRYVKLYYEENEWHIKITHIKNIDMVINVDNLNKFAQSLNGKLVSENKYRRLINRDEIFGQDEE